MQTIILNEEVRNQAVCLVCNIDKDMLDYLNNAKSANDTIRVNFKMGRSYYFKYSAVNHYRIDEGTVVYAKCGDKEIKLGCWNIARQCTNQGEYVQCDLFNHKYLKTETKVTLTESLEQMFDNYED